MNKIATLGGLALVGGSAFMMSSDGTLASVSDVEVVTTGTINIVEGDNKFEIAFEQLGVGVKDSVTTASYINFETVVTDGDYAYITTSHVLNDKAYVSHELPNVECIMCYDLTRDFSAFEDDFNVSSISGYMESDDGYTSHHVSTTVVGDDIEISLSYEQKYKLR
ncbi:MAG: hypothetical protein ATN35_10260 [Epulopiscium sp. Nele67-Bin004]|nr:MAG: hypothetical protein ATN35_10260 [Epulopiscium sp. Nele67-Bin004]